MNKIIIFLTLFISYVAYSAFVYTKGTAIAPVFPEVTQGMISKGKEIFQKNNCNSCHQIYGLGGYLGPELTTVWSDQNRGEYYIRAMLKNGGNRMPQYGFDENETEALVSYLRYIDSTATSYKSIP